MAAKLPHLAPGRHVPFAGPCKSRRWNASVKSFRYYYCPLCRNSIIVRDLLNYLFLDSLASESSRAPLNPQKRCYCDTSIKPASVPALLLAQEERRVD